ncbi:MAG: DUF1266 domain-containing protein [Deltaproteobacteria bacterium]|nr:DUF1266 domain-containing protein [Deltaproteobacteria bacterium]
MLASFRSLFRRAESPEVRAGKARMAIDHRDPDRRFVFGLLALSYSVDPAYLPFHASRVVCESYGLTSTVAVRERILQFMVMRRKNPGFDLFRGALLARAGYGAGLLGEDESWYRALGVATEVRSVFRSWPEVAASYEAGHLDERRSQGDSREVIAEHQAELRARVARLTRTIWRDTRFPLDLS